MNWKDINAKILAALDVAGEYESIGLRIAQSRRATATGWLPCHAMGREDKNPSAAINIGEGSLRGRYVDRGGEGETLSLFDFAAKYGAFKDWQDARKHYGKQTGCLKNFPKNDEERGVDKVELLKSIDDRRFDLMVKGMVDAYPGVMAEAIRLCGGRVGCYPKKSPTPRYVVAFPCYGPHLFDGGLQGYVIQPTDGGKIHLFRGEGRPTELHKRLTLGESGLIGTHGLRHLQNADVVWKAAGISDLLALQALIPPDQREKQVVITNAGGETEVHLVAEVAPLLAGKDVVIVHDADEPGQTGAKVWCGGLRGIAGRIRNLQLPFPVAEKHGADLRDWIKGE